MRKILLSRRPFEKSFANLAANFLELRFYYAVKLKIYLWLYCSEPKKCSNYNKPMPPTCWNKFRTCCYLFRSIYNIDKWNEFYLIERDLAQNCRTSSCSKRHTPINLVYLSVPRSWFEVEYLLAGTSKLSIGPRFISI